MLILERKARQKILIGNDVEMTVLEFSNHGGVERVKLGFDCPAHISIDREEVRASKTGRDWLGPPAGVFNDGWLVEDEDGMFFFTHGPVFAGGWTLGPPGHGECAVVDSIAFRWRFPEDLPFEKRIVPVGPVVEKGFPCTSK